MDLATATAARELYAWSVAEGYIFDVVINNAGMFSFCDILNTPVERLERIILLHDLTLTTMCRLYGEDMIKRGKGRLLNMSSYSIWMPFPGLASYSASKAYVKSFTEAFAKELRGTGVTATAICPAGIATDLYGLSKKLQRFGVKIGVLMTPKSCARRGLKAMFKGRKVVVPDWWFRLFIPICSYLPGFLIRPLRNFTMKWQK
jgi:short-subunit dehydrogenase